MSKSVIDTFSKKASGFYYYHLDSTNYSNLTVYDCGYEKFSSHLKVIRNKYPFYLMHCVLSGCGTVKLAGKEFTVHGGDIFVIPESAEVEYFQDVSDPWNYIYINFNGTAAVQFCREAGFSADAPVYTFRNREIQDKFFKLIDAKIRQTNIWGVYSVLFDIMSCIVKERPQKTDYSHQHGPKYLEDILDYVEKNFHHADLSLQVAADAMHLNPTYFSRVFHRITGVPFSKYLTMFRIQKSTTMLVNSNLSINEIARFVGFNDPLYFSTLFKKYRLMSPGDYRKNNAPTKSDPDTD